VQSIFRLFSTSCLTGRIRQMQQSSPSPSFSSSSSSSPSCQLQWRRSCSILIELYSRFFSFSFSFFFIHLERINREKDWIGNWFVCTSHRGSRQLSLSLLFFTPHPPSHPIRAIFLIGSACVCVCTHMPLYCPYPTRRLWHCTLYRTLLRPLLLFKVNTATTFTFQSRSYASSSSSSFWQLLFSFLFLYFCVPLFMIKETHTAAAGPFFVLLFDAGGDHVQIKSHYRGHHVAVWLQLIPQLHGRLDPSNNSTGDRTASIDPAVSSTHYQQQQQQQQRMRNSQQQPQQQGTVPIYVALCFLGLLLLPLLLLLIKK